MGGEGAHNCYRLGHRPEGKVLRGGGMWEGGGTGTGTIQGLCSGRHSKWAPAALTFVWSQPTSPHPPCWPPHSQHQPWPPSAPPPGPSAAPHAPVTQPAAQHPPWPPHSPPCDTVTHMVTHIIHMNSPVTWDRSGGRGGHMRDVPTWRRCGTATCAWLCTAAHATPHAHNP